MDGKLVTYVPVDIDTALNLYNNKGCVWVKSNFPPCDWVCLEKDWKSAGLLEEAREKCGVWQFSEVITAFHVKQEITIENRSI